MYQCYNCGRNDVHWCGDFDFEDYGIIEKQGIIHTYSCSHCNAEIEYYITFEEDDED